LLAGVAVVLIHQSRGLLVGEGISATTATRIRALAQAESAVTEVGPILSMYIGPDEALVTLSVQVDPLLPSGEVAHAVQRIESEIRALFPPIRRVYIEIGPPGRHPAGKPALGPHG
jgi:divalent metal cation (Fe/Co/Zn/Cd) transporter